MDRLALEESESRFATFVESLNEVFGHRDRTRPFRDYCAGLLAGCERKSVEPMAARLKKIELEPVMNFRMHIVSTTE